MPEKLADIRAEIDAARRTLAGFAGDAVNVVAHGHQCVGRHADIAPQRMIHGDDEKRHQAEHRRHHPGHRELRRQAVHLKGASVADSDDPAEDDDDPQRRANPLLADEESLAPAIEQVGALRQQFRYQRLIVRRRRPESRQLTLE